LPLRSELAMTFTGKILRSVMGRVAAGADPAGFEARNILILRPRASIFGTAEAVQSGRRRAR
jgi:hypothetical protein